ncbi:MAG: hypothetical protein K2Y02_11145 [Burkholderiaceae bacterium]|nr:hypothetical protein [Burkholderiaceae bacterium]
MTNLLLHPAGLSPSRSLIQLVAPGGGGVRDYVECLRQQWAQTGIESQVLALSEAEARQQSLASRLLIVVQAEGRPCSLILHFSGYGFQRRGLCFWLLREIEHARRELGDRLRLVTMFHELFASGPPWGSAFWLSSAQAWIAMRIARSSDSLWTNTELHARWLRQQIDGSVPIEVNPVFSTIGEPTAITPAPDRTPRLVVFGAPSTRGRALKLLPRHAARLRSQGITEVIEAGSGPAHPWTDTALLHRFVGRLEVAQVHDLLQGSAYGLIDYPPKYLGKSTVFAAYAAHGCVPLNTADPDLDSDGLQQARHFVTLAASGIIPRDAEARQQMGDAARDWYLNHSLVRQAQGWARACQITVVERTCA